MSEHDESDEIFKDAEQGRTSHHIGSQNNIRLMKEQEKQAKKQEEQQQPKSDKKISNKKKVIGGVGIFVLLILILFLLNANQSVQVEQPTQTDTEMNARLQAEVTRRVKLESDRMAAERNQIIEKMSRNFDCNSPQVFCHAQDTSEPYTSVVASLQSFQFLPDTPYEVYIEVYPLKVDSQNPQTSSRTGSVCSPNNIHLFLCQKVVMKNPALMANQIRELYALLTPSMKYRLQISGRPITAADIDLMLISTEIDKLNAEEATAASEPCVPPDQNTDPIAYNLCQVNKLLLLILRQYLRRQLNSFRSNNELRIYSGTI